MSKPTVAIIGASRDRGKYGNISLRAHRDAGYEVFPINPSAGEIEGIPAYRSLADIPGRRVDRVSLYVPPEIGIELLDEIAAVSPQEVWLNPGSESDALIERAQSLGLPIVVGCSIVDVKLRHPR
ncbi:MAG: CoA-binding protein [Planctomycetota bacterium]|nr:CoA-binding protein [Planctomycetota bacterium]